MDTRQKRSNFSHPNNIDHNVDFHGASLLNEYGKETAITEEMVRHACKVYIRIWETTQSNKNENNNCNSPANNSS